MVVRNSLLLLLMIFPLAVLSDSAIDVSYYKSGIQVRSSHFNVWQRELITINIEIETDDEFSYLKESGFRRDNYVIETRVLPAVALSGKKRFQKRLRIFIWPMQPGDDSVEIPDIELWLSGRVIKSFKSQPLYLTVKSLPDYLPPGFPVGSISHADHFFFDSLFPYLLKPDNLANYRLETITTGIHPSMLADYSVYLKNAAMSRLAASEVTEKFQYDLNYSYSRSQLIPVLPRVSGLYSFNEFKVLFFDAIEGKVNSYQFNGSYAVVLNTVFKLIILFLIFILVFYLFNKLKHFTLSAYSRRQLWKQLRQSDNPIELARLLRLLQPSVDSYSESNRVNNNLSLKQWAGGWDDEQLSQNIAALNRQNFSDKQDQGFDVIKSSIIQRLVVLDGWIYTILT